MRVLVRADGGAGIGLGHITRCLALASALRRRGAEVVFVTSPADPAVLKKIEAAGCRVETFAKEDGEDAAIAFLLAVAAKAPTRLVVADSYRIEPEHRRAIKAAGLKLLALDDFGTAAAEADYTLNPNLTERSATGLLFGPRYALLRPEFREAAGLSREKAGIPRILITMGGSDPAGRTREAWKALDAAPGEFAMDLLVGAAYKDAAGLANDAASARHPTAVHHDPPDVPGLMRSATLAVSAAGSTCWELACLGVPAIVLVTADNQTGVAESLVKSGFAVSPGKAFAKEAAALLGDPNRLKAMASAGRALVDGRGAERVADAVLA